MQDFLKHLLTILILAGVPCAAGFCGDRQFVTSERLTLGTELNRSASVRIADFDGDRDLDIVVANGRHWPQQNFVFLNQGRARFSIQRRIGSDLCTSYATEPIDMDGDGDIDIAVGNDMAPNRVFLNDGKGQFAPGPAFGGISSIRSLTVADIDRDGDADVLTTCRRRTNQICLNNGDGQFAPGRPFGSEADSTIDVAVADWNQDGHPDLVLANRDNQPNSILLNDGQLNFKEEIPFGTRNEQTRAVVVADLNGDAAPDIVTGNIGQPNYVYLGDGKGGFTATVPFGRKEGRTYALAVSDMDNDGDLDVVIANVGQQNAVFFNQGDGTNFSEVRFGNEADATYGLAAGDLDGDGFADIAVAHSGTRNFIFLNRPAAPDRHPTGSATKRIPTGKLQAARPQTHSVRGPTSQTDWTSFRGRGSRGIADGFPVPEKWNADETAGDINGVLWSTQVPGLGHSSPVISGERIFLTTAIAAETAAPLNVGRGGGRDAADDNGEQLWLVLCYDRRTGVELWRKTAHQGRPRVTRHVKATHANTSVAIAGDNVVAFFGSEGIHCYDLDGNLKWTRDLGIINISKYGIGWGYASSPAIHNHRIVIVCDDPDKPFVAALRLSDGGFIWRQSRQDICERSWGTPFIHSSHSRTQTVVNGWPWIVSYDLETGVELWRIRGGGDNPVPTPFEANGWIYITNAHGAESPIFVVRPDANGDISPPRDSGSNQSILWSTRRGGSYMSTPVVYGDYLYLGNTNGVIRCFQAKTGEKIYEQRLGARASIYSSLVAADGKIFCASENGTVYVVKTGPEFKVLAENQMGKPIFASPAIADGTLFFRTTGTLVAISRP